MQIVQELCRRPGLNKCGFEMSTIYIPNPQKVGPPVDRRSRLLLRPFHRWAYATLMVTSWSLPVSSSRAAA